MSKHEVASVTRKGRIWYCVCTCGAPFSSIESEGLARSYHQVHVRLEAKKV